MVVTLAEGVNGKQHAGDEKNYGPGLSNPGRSPAHRADCNRWPHHVRAPAAPAQSWGEAGRPAGESPL